jgi:hypothetical protein
MMTLFNGQRMRTESLGKLTPRSVVQIIQKFSTTSDIFVNWVRHIAMLKATGFCLLTPYSVEAVEKYSVTLYCFPSSTAHEVHIWIRQCSEASNTVGINKCLVTDLDIKCAQLLNYELQKCSPQCGMKQ